MQLTDIPGVGEKTAQILLRRDIDSLDKLLAYYPRTHRNFIPRTTDTVIPNEWTILVGTLTRPISRHTRSGSTQISTFQDSHGKLDIRWFNSPFITRSISPSQTYLVRGEISVFADRYQMVNPEIKICPADYVPIAELVPIYTPLDTLKSGHIRKIISGALSLAPSLEDPLTLDIQARYNLEQLSDAVRHIHFPASDEELGRAMHRLGFDELYALQKQALHNRELSQIKTVPLQWSSDLMDKWLNQLPFTPTNSQLQAINDITSDLGKPTAMHRLLQGEVGSGKTLVAAAAAMATASAGHRSLILAPTQILAEQLFSSLSSILPDLSISLFTQNSHGDLESQVLIGTQALLNLDTYPPNIALLIIDEQHRFGVEQRLLLTRFTPAPHYLQMTATPIPRTLALSLFSHLDISHLTELPPGRLPTKTFFVPPVKRSSAYSWVAQQVAHDNQAFIVVPVIERSIDQEENPRQSVKALETELKSLFPHLSLDILHGELKKPDITSKLASFRRGETQLLVATSMVEVGIDIPSANLIVIEDAERFGLAQLHQLRGRVGRGGGQGYCLVMSQSTSPRVTDRLKYFTTHTSGIELSHYDLTHRGPGELFGTIQHGLFNLRFANILDEQLLRDTLEAVKMSTI